jgi:hypothetical protein
VIERDEPNGVSRREFDGRARSEVLSGGWVADQVFREDLREPSGRLLLGLRQ